MKAKKSGVRRQTGATKSAGSTPIPTGPGSSGPTCGHHGCGDECRVRYVGQTSRITDHHMLHTARAVTNIWAAAIVVGLSVVLTGVIAFSAVQAQTENGTSKIQQDNNSLRADSARIASRLEMMEKALQEIRQLCVVGPPSTEASAPTSGKDGKVMQEKQKMMGQRQRKGPPQAPSPTDVKQQ